MLFRENIRVFTHDDSSEVFIETTQHLGLGDVADLLHSHQVEKVELQFANIAGWSHPTSSLAQTSSWDSSGVSATVVFDSTVSLNAFQTILRKLMAKRIIVAPLASLDKPRLRRYIHTANRTVTTILPTELSTASAESFQAQADLAGDCSRIWGDANLLSEFWLGMRPLEPVGRKVLRVSILRSNDCQNCYELSQTLNYFVNTNKGDSVFIVLPSASLLKGCDWVEPTFEVDGRSMSLSESRSAKLSSQGKQPAPYWSVRVGIAQNQDLDRKWWMVLDNDSDCEATAFVIQDLHDFFRPKWTSFSVKVNDQSVAIDESIVKPSTDGLQISWQTTIPASSTTELSFRFDPRFLGFEELTGDANRGFELPPALVTWSSTCHPSASTTSHSLLYLPPLPDSSMPFNVLSLTCTLFAFVFGSIINLLVKRASDTIRYKARPDLKPPSKLQKLKDKIKTKLSKGNR